WPCNRRRCRGWCARCCRRGPATTVERRRLLDWVPVFPVRRDHAGEDVFVGPSLAGTVILRLALLNADLGNEGHALELFETDRAGLACLWTRVVGFKTERAIENGLQRTLIDLDGLGVALGGARQNPVFPKFPALVRSIEDGEFDVEHFGK